MGAEAEYENTEGLPVKKIDIVLFLEMIYFFLFESSLFIIY